MKTRGNWLVLCAALGLLAAPQAWGEDEVRRERAPSSGGSGRQVVERAPGSQAGSVAAAPRHEPRRDREVREPAVRSGSDSSHGEIDRRGAGAVDDRRGDIRSRGNRRSGRHGSAGWGSSWWWDPYPYGYPYGYGYGYGLGWGWYGAWGPRGYYYYDSPERYRSSSGHQAGALDLDVSPERAEVYVDGRYVGRADDFDGFPTYLWLPKGTYDVVLYREGYETIARQYSIYPGLVIDVEDRMVPGEAKKPEELISKSTVNRDERLRRDREREAAAGVSGRDERWRERDAGEDGDGRWREPTREEERRAPEPEQEEAQLALLSLRVEPRDAAVYLDGRLLREDSKTPIELEAGTHKLEVVRPGFKAAVREFQARAGDRLDLVIELLSD